MAIIENFIKHCFYSKCSLWLYSKKNPKKLFLQSCISTTENRSELICSFATDLVVLAISVTATVLRQDAAPAVEHVALVTLAALRALLAAVPLASSRSTLWRADCHAAGVMAVSRTAVDWEQAGVVVVVFNRMNIF